jgi:hypothetical protein
MDFLLTPDAIAWKYPDVVFSFFLDSTSSPRFQNWLHPTIAQPTRSQLEAIIQEYLEHGIHQPDWCAFYELLENTAIELKILQSPNKLAVSKLTTEFGKREAEYFDVARLQRYWNAAIPNYNLLNASQIEQLNGWAEIDYLPIRFSSNGSMDLR